MAYNVHHCNPPSKPGIIDIDAIAGVIKKSGAQLVALQEIDVHTGRSGKIDQAAEIAKRAGFSYYYFSKAIDHDGGDYGVMMLSQFPLLQTITHRLPTAESTNGELRVLSLATVTLPGKKMIKFGSTHFDAQGKNTNRLLQAKELVQITDNENLPLIIAGDFNDVENSEVVKIISSALTNTCQSCPPTIPEINPNRAIDFIFYKPSARFKVLKHSVIKEPYASDHLPVVAELELQ